jgi:hypothetical protein
MEWHTAAEHSDCCIFPGDIVMNPRPFARTGSKPAPVDILQSQRDDAGWSQVRSSEEAGEPIAPLPGVRDDASPASVAEHRSGGHAREQMIREAAYLRYQAHGCEEGHAIDDWLAAEAEIAALFPTATADPAFQPERPDDGVLP